MPRGGGDDDLGGILAHPDGHAGESGGGRRSNPGGPGIDGVFGTADDTEVFFLPNVTPDEGLSAPFNSWMTLFGQFFDHGLDLANKGGSGTVFIPLLPDDPLYQPGSPTNFMALTRSTPAPGQPTETVNTTTSWIDQNQTYTSHASHQVFLREYKFSADSNNDGVLDSRAVSTGKLLDGATGGIATWAETKAQAKAMLGIVLTDADVLNVPLLRTDAYGNFIPGANGYAQIATATGFVEGSAAALSVAVTTQGAPGSVEWDDDRPRDVLASLRTRVALYGGELVVGRRRDGAVRVSATFPLPAGTGS